MTVRSVNLRSVVSRLLHPRRQAKHSLIAERIRLSGKTIGVQRPCLSRVQEDMRPMFDRLWRELGPSAPVTDEPSSTHQQPVELPSLAGLVSRGGSASPEIKAFLQESSDQSLGQMQSACLGAQQNCAQGRNASHSQNTLSPSCSPVHRSILLYIDETGQAYDLTGQKWSRA